MSIHIYYNPPICNLLSLTWLNQKLNYKYQSQQGLVHCKDAPQALSAALFWLMKTPNGLHLPLHWEAGCHPIWMMCQHAFWPEEVSLPCSMGIPSEFSLWAPVEQKGKRQSASESLEWVNSIPPPPPPPPCREQETGLTASLRHIFFSSSTFCRSFSCRSCSFFFSSKIFSFFCSSLTSESWDPGGINWIRMPIFYPFLSLAWSKGRYRQLFKEKVGLFKTA